MHCCATLVRASLVLVAIGGAATAGPFEDAVAAYRSGDYAAALRVWRRLAEQGDADAQFRLGVMYESGQGMLRNDAEAISWYRKAAEQDDAVAQFNLGVMYAKGVSPNHAEAALWYRRAADYGLAGAQFNLGMMYGGGEGVPQDYVQAHMWLNLSASQLPALGKDQRNTTVDARDCVESKMTPQQIGEAQELAFEWTTNTATWGDYAHFLKACTSTTGRWSALPSCLIKLTRREIWRAQQSTAALAFMVSYLRIEARSPLVVRRT